MKQGNWDRQIWESAGIEKTIEDIDKIKKIELNNFFDIYEACYEIFDSLREKIKLN